MRRVVMASICAAVVWFGIMELGGGALRQGQLAQQAAGTSYTKTVSLQYEARTLLSGGPGASRAGTGTEAGEGFKADDEKAETSEAAEAEGPEVGDAAQAVGVDQAAQGDQAKEANQAAQAAGEAQAVQEGKLAKANGGEGESGADRQRGKIVYLTFDDGPSRHTPEVLRILEQEGIKATFFVLGEHVEEYPEIAKRIVEEGHAIGNHTYNHKYEELYGSFGEFANQIIQTDNEIFKATGVRTTLMRAPGGSYRNMDQGYFEAMDAAGYSVHDWNVDSGDSKRRGVPASEIVANIKASRIADTLNVLLHDSTGHEESVKALPQIIQYYKALGYSFEVLEDDVKPMQFQVAEQSKWSRGKLKASDRERLVAFGRELDASGQRQLSAYREPALIVHRGEERLVLEANQYRLIDGAIQVPLLSLTEWLGAEAELDTSSGVVEASFMGKRVFWISDAWPPADAEHQADVEVPLRATLGEFGLLIEDYVYTKDQREVWIQEHP
ncbi:polysaccharide deacetylase family protein [Paenibacillus sp. PL2-23]|uniref:polysaccharide deacetylase family protein n=1 Tax=Paenibacillus sp. PL2-23 TaxID=2100729 RepID=UPI0030F564E4